MAPHGFASRGSPEYGPVKRGRLQKTGVASRKWAGTTGAGPLLRGRLQKTGPEKRAQVLFFGVVSRKQALRTRLCAAQSSLPQGFPFGLWPLTRASHSRGPMQRVWFCVGSVSSQRTCVSQCLFSHACVCGTSLWPLFCAFSRHASSHTQFALWYGMLSLRTCLRTQFSAWHGMLSRSSCLVILPRDFLQPSYHVSSCHRILEAFLVHTRSPLSSITMLPAGAIKFGIDARVDVSWASTRTTR